MTPAFQFQLTQVKHKQAPNLQYIRPINNKHKREKGGATSAYVSRHSLACPAGSV